MKRSKEISIVIVTEADISSVMTEQAGWENSIGNSCCQIRNIRITILIEFTQSVPRFFQRLRVLILIFIPNVYGRQICRKARICAGIGITPEEVKQRGSSARFLYPNGVSFAVCSPLSHRLCGHSQASPALSGFPHSSADPCSYP